MAARYGVFVHAGIFLCMVGVVWAAKIKSDYDKTVDFSVYKTYAWGQNVGPTRAAASMFIRGSIDGQLQGAGLKETDIDHADVVVRYGAASDSDMAFAPASDPTYSYIGGAPLPGATVWSP